MEAGGEVAIPFRVHVESWPVGPINKVAYAVDVTADGEHLGQIAEGLVVQPRIVKALRSRDGT